VKYYTLRARANLQLIDKLDLVGQTSEFARVFGIEFYHVLSRGSQVGDKNSGGIFIGLQVYHLMSGKSLSAAFVKWL
jgi:hypothetical protein